MKVSELLNDVKAEIEQDKVNLKKSVLKERLLEIEEAKRVLSELENQLNELLKEEV